MIAVTLAATIFGLIIGSFLNVFILRHPTVNKSLPATLSGRSQCPHCHHQLSARDLIPVISWLIQRGQCNYCQAPISPQYSIIELVIGIAAGLLFTPPPLSVQEFITQLVALIISTQLVILFVIDLRTFLLPDSIVFPLTIMALAYSLLLGMDIVLALFGTLIGAGFLGLLWLITKGAGIGLGDVKLMIPLGIIFGPMDTTILLLVAFIAGGLFGIALLSLKQATMRTAVPFGPFLAGVALLFLAIPTVPASLFQAIWY